MFATPLQIRRVIVVGYANDALKPNTWRPVASQFLKIGSKDGADMKLGELIPGGTWAVKTDYIKVISSEATVEYQAKYFGKWSDLNTAQKKKFDNDESKFVPGWYKCAAGSTTPDFEQCANECPLPFGTAILASTPTTDAYFTSNGEVVQCDPGDLINIPLVPNEWKFVANCTPVDRTLGEIIPGGTWAVKTDYIKVISAEATVDFQAKYFGKWSDLNTAQKKKFDNDESKFVPGWYKCAAGSTTPDFEQCANSTPIPAGQGFLASTPTDGAFFTLPPAL